MEFRELITINAREVLAHAVRDEFVCDLGGLVARCEVGGAHCFLFLGKEERHRLDKLNGKITPA